jgi:hypothetical protein
VSDVDSDESFTFTLTASQGRYRAGQLIEVSATLEFLGPGSEAVMLGSGHGFIGFGVKSSDPPVITHPVSTSDCSPHEISNGVPQVFPFVKSGGYSEGDPADAFARAFLATEDLRLPPGTWTIFAGTGFYTAADCGVGPLHSLTTEVTITVEP